MNTIGVACRNYLHFVCAFLLFSREACGYILVEQYKTWYDAEAYCLAEYGTHLATIYDDASAEELKQECFTGSTWDYFWIGLNDLTTNGFWEYSGGDFDCSAISATTGCGDNALYKYWQDNKPDLLDIEHCTRMIHTWAIEHFLDNMQCAAQYPFVCNSPQENDVGCVLYSADTVTTTANNLLTSVAIGDEMHFEFDVVIHTIPGTWASIFHCGATNTIRMPGIWLHPESDNDGLTWEGFTLVYSTTANWNMHNYGIGPHIVVGTTYHFELDITQSTLLCTINGEEAWRDDAYANHNTYDSQPCYSGDPWYQAADVSITNLIISTPGDCSSDLPTPKLSYTFDGDHVTDLELRDGASVSDGALTCNNGYAISSSNLDFAFQSHSLEAWVKMNSLSGYGGAAIAIDSNYNSAGGYGHNKFDAIVYNERYSGEWMFGSDYFRRTQHLAGAQESVTGDWIHLVAVYDVENNQHVMYRNGVQYGNSYAPGSWFTGTPSDTAGQRLLFCIRHMRTQTLLASIGYGAVYDYALSADEVAALYAADQASYSSPQMDVYRPEGEAQPDPRGIVLDWNSSSVLFIAGVLALLLVVNLVMMAYANCCGGKNGRARYQTVKMVDSDVEASEAEAINIQ